jgi:sec-independent protein translocase protein TatC
MTSASLPAGTPTTAGKELTIIEHLVELRNRVIICCIALIVGFGVAVYPLTKWTMSFLVRPAQDQIEGFKLNQFTLLDYWSTYFRVSLLLAIAIAMPVLMYQILAFVGPGLTREEKRWLYPIVGGCSAMFIAGMAFAYYVVLPPGLDFLLDPNTDDVQSTIGVQTYIDTITRLLLLNGIVFQLPFVIMALAKIGVVTSRKLWEWKAYALVMAVVLAAIVTPSIDPITQGIVAVPIIILYFAGMLLARLVEGTSFIGARRNPPA